MIASVMPGKEWNREFSIWTLSRLTVWFLAAG